jgi:hypothetical protein
MYNVVKIEARKNWCEEGRKEKSALDVGMERWKQDNKEQYVCRKKKAAKSSLNFIRGLAAR